MTLSIVLVSGNRYKPTTTWFLTMQDILTIAINVTTITAVSFFLMQFFAGLMSTRNRIALGQLSLFSNDELLFQCYAETVQDDGEWLAEVQQQVEPVAAVAMVDRVVPCSRPVRKQAIDWDSAKLARDFQDSVPSWQ